MSEVASHDAPVTEPSDARFGMRSLLGAMTFVAVMAAIGGAVLQRLAPEVRTRLVAFWAIWLAASIAYIAVAFQQRKRAEQQAGRTILQLPMSGDSTIPSGSGSYAITWMPLILGAWGIASFLVADSPSLPSATDWAISHVFPTFIAVASVAAFVRHLLWQDRVRFCELGILLDRKILPWDQLLEFRWTGLDKNELELHSVDGTNPWLKLPVSADKRAAVIELLEGKLAGAPRLPAEAHRVGIGQTPISAVVLKPHLRRHLVYISMCVLCGLGLVYLGWIRGSGVREFDDAYTIGIYLFLATHAWTLRWFVRHSGTLQARVFGRRDALGLAATVAAAVGIFHVNATILWPFAWLGYAAGLAFVYLSFSAFSYYFLTQLDLRSEGVVMPGAFCWPWRSVRLREWDRNGSGRLVLGHRWRRVVAYVPPEQCEAVDAVLREKLGVRTTPTPNVVARGN